MKVEMHDKRSGLSRLLAPRSIAIVGASPNPGSFGAVVLGNLRRAGYSGDLYLVNPKRSEIDGVACLASVDELPESVDCAVLTIPRASVLTALEACERRKVGGVIIFSTGFAESGASGRADQLRIKEIADRSGMIIEGPNCIGMVNAVEGVPLTFVTMNLERTTGSNGVAVLSQSGAIAAVLGVSLRHRDLEVSMSISTGNEAASGIEDFLEYMIHDTHTRVVALIVEQFRQPKRFLELVRAARDTGKFVVLLHPGRSSAGRISAQTHTGAMAGDYQVMKTKAEHAGVLLVETLEELVDVSDVLIRCQSLPRNGCAVLTESGAFKAITLDQCEALNIDLPAFGESTIAGLRSVLPDFILPTNPLDLTGQPLIDPSLYTRTLPLLLEDTGFGSVMLTIILTDKVTSDLKLPPILDAIRAVRPAKALIFVAMDEGAQIESQHVSQLRELGVPFFPSPERAFRALSLLHAYTRRLERKNREESPSSSGIQLATGVIPEYVAKQILAKKGIRVSAGDLAGSLEQAQQIAEKIGFPVALKAQASSLSHKSDVGGVALGLHTPLALAEAWNGMYEAIGKAVPGLALDGLLVEKMEAQGVELIVGARNDPDWGPVLLVGLGGVLAEMMDDVRLLPPELSEEAIREELLLLKGAAMLRGYRGSAPLDVEAVARLASHLGSFILAEPRVLEVDINPVVVYPVGAVALDAVMVVSPGG
ncbi:MAG TPA: acetate--CoA ligase family protein [Acidobacteriaceae bacterium]